MVCICACICACICEDKEGERNQCNANDKTIEFVCWFSCNSIKVCGVLVSKCRKVKIMKKKPKEEK